MLEPGEDPVIGGALDAARLIASILFPSPLDEQFVDELIGPAARPAAGWS